MLSNNNQSQTNWELQKSAPEDLKLQFNGELDYIMDNPATNPRNHTTAVGLRSTQIPQAPRSEKASPRLPTGTDQKLQVLQTITQAFKEVVDENRKAVKEMMEVLVRMKQQQKTGASATSTHTSRGT